MRHQFRFSSLRTLSFALLLGLASGLWSQTSLQRAKAEIRAWAAETVLSPRCELSLKGGRLVLLGYVWAHEVRELPASVVEDCEALATAALKEMLECSLPSSESAGSLTGPGVIECPVKSVRWSFQVPKTDGSGRYSEVASGKVRNHSPE